MSKTNNNLPKRLFIAKTEKKMEIRNEKIASFAGKYTTSKMPIIGTYNNKKLTNIKIIEKSKAIVK
ncbi:hypothetical protein [Peribacillus muralis]|uniref:hypothetical protein n=1 Tax=Peribacillus muralis TaxID=264697 RepID=UPI0036722906